MTLSARNHGTWEPYTPDQLPNGFPAMAMFARRTSDHVDWYDFVNRTPSPFARETVKMTVMIIGVRRQHIVQAANRDETTLFPQNSMLIEVTGIDTPDRELQQTFGGKIYNPAAQPWDPWTSMFTAQPEQMMPLNDRSFYQELAMRGFITRPEAIAAVRTGVLPPKLQAIVDALPPDDRFTAEMWLAGNSFQFGYWLMNEFRDKLGITEQEWEDFWRHAMTLGGPTAVT